MSLPSTRISVDDNAVKEGRRGGIYVALGSNSAFVDDSGQRLEGAGLFRSVLHVFKRAGFNTLRKSSLWLSPAWPDQTLNEFQNAVVELDSICDNAQVLMRFLLEIEDDFGRVRHEKNGSRTLDLDLIDFRGQVMEAEKDGDLILPHPRMHERSFVLSPLKEIAPEWGHPVMSNKVQELEPIAQKKWPATVLGEF